MSVKDSIEITSKIATIVIAITAVFGYFFSILPTYEYKKLQIKTDKLRKEFYLLQGKNIDLNKTISLKNTDIQILKIEKNKILSKVSTLSLKTEIFYLKQFINETQDTLLKDFKSLTIDYMFAKNRMKIDNNSSIIIYNMDRIFFIDLDKKLLENNSSIKLLKHAIVDVNSSLLDTAIEEKLKIFALKHIEKNNTLKKIIQRYKDKTNIENIFKLLNENALYLINLKNDYNKHIDLVRQKSLILHEQYIKKITIIYTENDDEKSQNHEQKELDFKYKKLADKLQNTVDNYHKIYKEKLDNHRNNTLNVIFILIKDIEDEYLVSIEKRHP